MPPLLIQQVRWPGVVAVESFFYECLHGISPGTAILTTYPQQGPIAAFGDLVLGDGRLAFKLRDCRVSRMTPRATSEGQVWTLEIQDRRWRWMGLGGISGSYNEKDTRKKLVPWTIRSPYELVKLIFDYTGEKNWKAILPPGLPRAIGANLDHYLRLGENFPQTLANPETVFDHAPPMEVLARICDQWGVRVVYQPVLDRVLLTPLGRGRTLPDLPCEAMSSAANNPRVPASVNVAGAPVRIQARFALEPVGEEWDGSIKNINELSYAPRVPAVPQISTATFTGSGNPSALIVYVTVVPGALSAERVFFQKTGGTVATKLAALAAAMNAHQLVGPILKATATATVLTLTGKDGAMPFGVDVDSVGTVAPDKFVGAIAQLPGPKNGVSWRFCPPPLFPTVRATDELSFSQAQQKARKSVFKWYRLLFVDPHRGVQPFRLPWYKGKLVRRQQIILQQTKVAQVEPAPRRAGLGNRDNPVAWGAIPLAGLLGGNVLPEFYDGYSRDQAATVTGSISKWIPTSVYPDMPSFLNLSDANFNTAPGDQVYLDFDIEPFEQLVRFGTFVFKTPNLGSGAFVEPAALTLETACLVRDAETSAIVRWEESLKLGGVAAPEWEHREDVQVGVIGDYFDDPDPNGGARNALLGFSFGPGDLADAKGRASYYLNSMRAKYQLSETATRSYIGVVPIDPDGVIQQLTITFGPGGPTTTVSANTEHSIATPNYPQRRRPENLPPNKLAALANQVEFARAAIPQINPMLAKPE